jgi:hypothetical protein
MAVAALLAVSLLAATPAAQPIPVQAPAAAGAAASPGDSDAGDDDAPAGAPTDDYGFVAWCYGALSEYLSIYDLVKPDLKDIDKMFGSPVQEDEPYKADVAGERVALRRFGAAIEAAERASLKPIAAEGAADIQAGRTIWAAAKLEPRRRLADAWLFWGVPKRCETTATALKARSVLLGQVWAKGAPSAIEQADAEPAPSLGDTQGAGLEVSAPSAAPRGPPPTPPRAGAVLIDAN